MEVFDQSIFDMTDRSGQPRRDPASQYRYKRKFDELYNVSNERIPL
jgi:hypothetical protein